MSRCRQQVRNKLAQIVVMEFGKTHHKHNGLFTRANLLRTCCGLATGKLRGETGVMDFGKLVRGKLLTCYMHRG